MDAVHHRVCPGPLTAAVLEGRLIRAWAPPFNAQGKVGAGAIPGTAARPAPARGGRSGGSPPAPPEPWRRRPGRAAGAAGATWTRRGARRGPGRAARALSPSGSRRFARSQRYEDAARVRDEAERLRHLLGRHRRVESLRRAGRVVLLVDGEGTVELDGGLLVEAASLFDGGRRTGRAGSTRRSPMQGDGHDNERVIVAQWLRANADRVRVLEADGPDGLAMRADRIPRLAELCAALAEVTAESRAKSGSAG